jgi:protein ImuB
MTARTLCVWFPDWRLRRRDAPPGEPCQVVGDGVVLAANRRALAAGVAVGMRRRQAETLCPSVVTLAADPGAEAAAFEAVAAAVEDLVPRVEVAAPGLLFVPVAGAVGYYGGEGPLVERVAATVEEAGGAGARLGLADGPFAARLAAETAADGPVIVSDTRAFLAGLDVSVLGMEEMAATLRWLGITTLGALEALPREAVASRFGPPGLEAHRLAGGEDRWLQPRPLPEDLAVEERFDPPLQDLEQAAFAARALAHRLIEGMGPWGGAPHRVVVEAESAAGVARSRTWRSPDPFGEAEVAERVRWQLRAWVETGGVPGALAVLRLLPADRSDRGRQLHLGDDAASQAEAARALARAQALVGPEAVLQARPQGGRRPGERVLWHRWGDPVPAPERDPRAPWPGRLPGPSPALVPPEPRPLEVEWDGGSPERVRLGSRWEPVLAWAGPWRHTGRWWAGEGAADRYQVVTSAGAILFEVRGGACYLAGVYD